MDDPIPMNTWAGEIRLDGLMKEKPENTKWSWGILRWICMKFSMNKNI